MKYKYYWAGPLFNLTQREYNNKSVARIEAAGFPVFLPQRDSGELGKDGNASEIKQKDLEGLKESEIVIANMWELPYDEGTIYEIGWAEAMGKPTHIISGRKRIENAMFAKIPQYFNFYKLLEALKIV